MNNELETIIDTVNNQADGRSHGCLSMHAERLLVAEIASMRQRHADEAEALKFFAQSTSRALKSTKTLTTGS